MKLIQVGRDGGRAKSGAYETKRINRLLSHQTSHSARDEFEAISVMPGKWFFWPKPPFFFLLRLPGGGVIAASYRESQREIHE